MAEERLELVTLRDDFYRDSIGKLMLLLTSFVVGIVLLMGASLYLYLDKPKPVTFPVLQEWRVEKSKPVDDPNLSAPEVVQWVGDVLRNVFVFDFNNYEQQLTLAKPYFTENGWNIFLDQLNNYVNQNNVVTAKEFVNAVPDGAPIILNQGVLSDGALAGHYIWWLQMPISIQHIGKDRRYSQALTFQVMVVRVAMDDNLTGVAIDNIMVAKGNV